MSVKDCHHHPDDLGKLPCKAVAGVLGFIILVLLVIFLIWAIPRPTKPQFVLMDATVFAFNVSNPPNFISTNLQITISSRNPNDRIGIYYDKLDVYATYCGQQITPPTPLPSAYQGHKDVNSWCPFVCGNWVPVAPYLAVTLAQDQVAGTGLLNIKVDGRMRWRVGSFISGSHHLHVNCPAYISFGNTNSGISVGPAVKYQLAQSCHVDV